MAFRAMTIAGFLMLGVFPTEAVADPYTYTLFQVSGMSTEGRGINNAGEIISLAGASYLFDGSNFSPISYPGATGTQTLGINQLGQIVGTYVVGLGSQQGFVYDGINYTTLNYPGSLATLDWEINAAGHVVGEAVTASGIQGFFFDGTSFDPISYPDADFTVPIGINDADEIVGGYFIGSTSFAFIFSGNAYTMLSVPGSIFSQATGINNAGDIVGNYGTSTGNVAFIYEDGAFTTISVPGTYNTQAYGLNDQGDIVGFTTFCGVHYGFVASKAAPPIQSNTSTDACVLPEPGNLPVLGASLIGMILASRKARSWRRAIQSKKSSQR